MVVDNECVNCLENQMAYYGRCFSCGLDEVIQADNVSFVVLSHATGCRCDTMFRKVNVSAYDAQITPFQITLPTVVKIVPLEPFALKVMIEVFHAASAVPVKKPTMVRVSLVQVLR